MQTDWCAMVSFQLTLDQFHAAILSGMSESPAADGDGRDETLLAYHRQAWFRLVTRELIAIWILHFNNRNTSLINLSSLVMSNLR